MYYKKVVNISFTCVNVRANHVFIRGFKILTEIIMESRLFTGEEVAAMLRCKPITVRQWVARGLIGSTKLGNKRLYTQDDVETFIASRRHEVKNGN